MNMQSNISKHAWLACNSTLISASNEIPQHLANFLPLAIGISHAIDIMYTLTTDTKISETLTPMMPYAAFSHIGFSSRTTDATEN